ncbi:hypothetical protein C7293_09540 [filamentous cyanobacterium CCT1]|nr:hypothetical protein C7293_09540 [filamentous cyanobacterium CCT1]PSN78217.1 hypothetical protein C8B47_18065 [filamentous cyanobacterium CCP4]
MTFDEIQQTLEQMLAVQRELQESQIAQRQEIQDMLIYQDRQQRLVDRMIGYSITNESDYLTLEERINALDERIKRLEGRESSRKIRSSQ